MFLSDFRKALEVNVLKWIQGVEFESKNVFSQYFTKEHRSDNVEEFVFKKCSSVQTPE